MACDQQKLWRDISAVLWGVALLAVVMSVNVMAQNAFAQAVLSNPKFIKAYDSYYADLHGYDVEVLAAEFSDTVEDALITGSHIKTTSIRYKVRHFEDVVHKELTRRLCSATSPQETPEKLKETAVNSLRPAGAEVDVDISPDLYGRLSALLMRVLELSSRPRFCASTSFENLDG